MNRRPKLIVFDLDYTLWPFWVDTHVTPPFRKKSSEDVVDSNNQKIKFYHDVPKILSMLHKESYVLGVASRTGEIAGANQLLQLFDWDRYFQFKEIFPGNKVAHFNNFKKKSGLEFKDMLFFDDEDRNIRDVSKIGVTSILVKNGLTVSVLQKGLDEYARQHPV